MELQKTEHILVGLSAAPSSARIIRSAASMAAARSCRFTALYVKTPRHAALTEEDLARLRENIRLAEQLGATVETVCGDDVALQMAEFARLSGVTVIVIGRCSRRQNPLHRPTIPERLVAITPGMDIHIIPDRGNSPYRPRKWVPKATWQILAADAALCIGFLIPATSLGFWFENMGFGSANIITVYLLCVLLTSAFTRSTAGNILCALGAVLSFNYFFTLPRFSLISRGSGYHVTFLIMLAAGLLIGFVTSQWKKLTRASARSAYRTNLIFETNQLLQDAYDEASIFQVAADQLSKLLDRGLTVSSADSGEKVTLGSFRPHPDAVRKVLMTKRQRDLCYPIRVNDRLYGVVDLEENEEDLEPFQNSILLSILGECALALENIRNAREKEAAKLQAEQEKLRANLLRSISHDLRTPLTSISGNAGILLAKEGQLDEGTRRQMYLDMADDSQWLITLVENLLAVTRIQQDRVELRLEPQLLEEILDEAMKKLSRQKAEHEISVICEDEPVLALCEPRLIMQVFINLLDNAIRHTPCGSHITVRICRTKQEAVVHVEDDGPGIPDKTSLFEMFYTGSAPVSDGHRSLGLGLSLCRSIIEAHGGEISVSDHRPHGAVFTFTLPVPEVDVYA